MNKQDKKNIKLNSAGSVKKVDLFINWFHQNLLKMLLKELKHQSNKNKWDDLFNLVDVCLFVVIFNLFIKLCFIDFNK
jgi:hypothetical protein